ncbi:hypothetical protein EOD39_6900 [Acipenser ruthenus]|uniref:V-type proton ATPase subunit d 1 n=1 Tax=Acipenser ruthenus TaxID=7906 RepID=A0A444U8L2_ACIRT|nr:hypothetical protein EOD39_6900 [Acipenser ruthenus]
MAGYSELYFNVDSGYLEGLVRGFKAGILKQIDYQNLVQCETVEVKTALTRNTERNIDNWGKYEHDDCGSKGLSSHNKQRQLDMDLV